MLVAFPTPTQPTGSIDGTVYYRNGGQIAARSRSRPRSPTSNARTYMLNLITVLSAWWEHPLTDADRIAWGAYAFNSPLVNAWGAPRFIKGYAQFMRSNRPRLQQGLDYVSAGPTTYGYPTYTLPTFFLPPHNATVQVSFAAFDDWTVEDGAALLLWASRSASPTRLTPAETYRPIGAILGSSTSPPTPPVTLPMPSWLPTANITCWIRSSVTRADGRLSG